jgi:hypothetical protein
MITFMNSWGTGWGDRGYGYLPYEYFTTFLQEAWTTIFSRGSQLTREIRRVTQTFVLREIGFWNTIGNFCVLIDLWDVVDDIRIGWCIATIRDDWFDIEDLFIRLDHAQEKGHLRRLMFRIQNAQHIGNYLLDFGYRGRTFTTNLVTLPR